MTFRGQRVEKCSFDRYFKYKEMVADSGVTILYLLELHIYAIPEVDGFPQTDGVTGNLSANMYAF